MIDASSRCVSRSLHSIICGHLRQGRSVRLLGGAPNPMMSSIRWALGLYMRAIQLSGSTNDHARGYGYGRGNSGQL